MRGRTRGNRGNGVRGQRVVLARARRSRALCSSGRGRPRVGAGRNPRFSLRATAVNRIRAQASSEREVAGLAAQIAVRPDLHEPREPGVACWFGATCVGVLLERMRLHLGTQRFLAERRGDRMWEASCDYAALSLQRLESRLRPGMFGAPLFPANPRTLSGKHRKECGTRHEHSAAVVARLSRGGVVSLAPGNAPRLKTRATVKATAAARGGR